MLQCDSPMNIANQRIPVNDDVDLLWIFVSRWEMNPHNVAVRTDFCPHSVRNTSTHQNIYMQKH